MNVRDKATQINDKVFSFDENSSVDLRFYKWDY